MRDRNPPGFSRGEEVKHGNGSRAFLHRAGREHVRKGARP